MLTESGDKQPDRIEDAFDIQIHHLRKRLVRVGVEFLTPCCTGIREQDVDMICGLGNLAEEVLDTGKLAAVCGDGDGFGAGPLVRERIESVARCAAGVGLPRGDVNFRAAGLEETALIWSAI